ncbi:MAG: hypothetical protein KDD70_17925 [Bdellovibrionales bacterium]|nr:hypothetical protein [Bdellovibrionales bacterium]
MRFNHFKVLSVDPDAESRLRLKELLRELCAKLSFHAVAKHNKACAKLEAQEGFDAVFVRSTAKRGELESLIDEIKNTSLKTRPLVILLVRGSDFSADYVSQFMLKGFDGVLREPYAADEIQNVLEIAEKNNSKQISEERKEAAASLVLMKDALSQIDEAARTKSNTDGKAGGYGLKRMRELTPVIRSLLEKVSDENYQLLLQTQVFERLRTLDLSTFKRRPKGKKKAIHPGAVLKNILEERSIPIATLAQKLALEEEAVLLIIDGRKSISRDVAAGLARNIGNTEDYWNGLQREYDQMTHAQGNK